MEVDQLTDEQVANLTPEQIEMLENDPGKLSEILGIQEAPKEAQEEAPDETTEDQPKREAQQSALDDTHGSGDEEEPVVLNKSGKGIIPYEKHKALRVREFSAARAVAGCTGRPEYARRASEAKG